jgi:hypothetical protein
MMQSDGLTANYHPGPMRINADSSPLIKVSVIFSKSTIVLASFRSIEIYYRSCQSWYR